MIFKKKTIFNYKLFKELDSLNYSERVAKIILLGKSTDREEYVNFLNKLLEGGQYEANLALIGAKSIKEEQVILKALNHDKASIRIKASSFLGQVVNDDNILKVIDDLSYECRRKFLHSIVTLNRSELSDKLFPHVYKKWGEDEAVILLAACSEKVVNEWIERIGYKVRSWQRVALNHPVTISRYFERCLKESSPGSRRYVWYRMYSAVEVLCNINGEFILDCALKYGPKNIILNSFYDQTGILLKANKDKLFEILVHEECRHSLILKGVPKCVIKRKNLLSKEQLVDLGRLLIDKPVHIRNIMERFKSEDKAEFFKEVFETEKFEDRIIDTSILEILPEKLRDNEAERMLKIRHVKEDKYLFDSLMSLRSIEKVREYFVGESRISDVEKRGDALAYLVKSTALSRRGMNETLAYLQRIKNDQDLVKYEVLSQMAKSSYKNFTDNEAEYLESFVNSVIDSRDVQGMTKREIEKLAFKIIRYSSYQSKIFKTAIRMIVKLAKKDGCLSFNTSLKTMPEGVEDILFSELKNIMIEENKSENYILCVAFAESLGKRGSFNKELQSLLRQTALETKYEYMAIRAVNQYLLNSRTRDERVRELLNQDKTFIKLEKIFTYVHRKRQDWLDEFILNKPLKGKFLSGKTIYVLPAEDGFFRWLPRQQRAFSKILEDAAIKTSYNISLRCNFIETISKVPEVDIERLMDLAKSSYTEVAASAFKALSISDEAEKAMRTLLRYLDTDKAGAAMYSLPVCLKKVRPVLLTSVIKDLLEKDNLKITVRKELIRMLAKFKCSESLSLISKEFYKENVHKDVKIAIGSAVRSFLEVEESWYILKEIAYSSEYDVAASILKQSPQGIRKEYRRRYLELIIDITKGSNRELSKEAYERMAMWKDGNEELIAKITSKCITDLNNTVLWETALYTLARICIDGTINKYIIDIYKSLTEETLDEAWNTAEKRDMPHRQRLIAVTNKIVGYDYFIVSNLKPLYFEIIKVLKEKKRYVNLLVKFYLSVIDWNKPEETAQYIKEAAKIFRNYPYYLSSFYTAVENSVEKDKNLWEAKKLLEIVDKVWGCGIDEAVFISFTLLKAAGEKLLWSEDCKKRLNDFRKHENMQISLLTYNTWYIEE